jgi:hypothetical protein
MEPDGPGWGQQTFLRYTHLLMLFVAHLDVDAERLAELVAIFKAPAIAAAQRGDHYKRPAEREPHGRGVPWDLDYQANKIAPKVSENNLSAPSIGIIENHCNVKLDCNCAIHASGGTDAANGASPYYRYNLGDVNGDPEGLLKASLEAWERNPDPLADEKPPYRVLVAVAREVELSFEDHDEGIMGKSTYTVARRIFDEMDPAEV